MSDIFDFIDSMDSKPSKEKLFDFKEQMAIGDAGEKDFVTAYSSLGPKKSEDLAYDFVLNDGKKVELKTDNYRMNESQNFFIETSSHGKWGGPSRAFFDDVDLFVYYFIRDKTYFWFNTKTLYKTLAPLIMSGRFELKIIKNKGWSAQGYAIPRRLLQEAVLHEDYCP